MAPYSFRHCFARISFCASAILLLLSVLPAAAQAQTGHTWNGVTSAEDLPYPGAILKTGHSILGHEALNGNGQFVVFSSTRPDLVPGDTNGKEDVFVRNRWTGQTEMISVAPDGSPANGASTWPSISENGRHVAFRSCASNLVPDDTNGLCDIFVHDRVFGTTARVSIGPAGEEIRYSTNGIISLSSDGRYIVFVSIFTGYTSRVYLLDRDTDANGIFDEPGTFSTTQISPEMFEGLLLYEAVSVTISGNGRIIAYTAAGYQDGQSRHILLAYDRETSLTSRIDLPASGLPDLPGNSYWPDLDEEGQNLVYTSSAPNLVTDDGDDISDLFVYDFQTATNTRLRLSHPVNPPINGYWTPSISGDGRYVAFMGEYRTMNTSSFWSFAIDRQGGSYEISLALGEFHEYSGNGGATSISADGSAIAFNSSGQITYDNESATRNIYVAIDLTLSPSTIEVPAVGGDQPIDVVLPDNTFWRVFTPASEQIVLAQPPTGTGPGTVSFTVLPNTSGAEKNTFVYLGTKYVFVKQRSGPVVWGAIPSYGPLIGGTAVQIVGRAFAQGATVTIGGKPAIDLIVVDSTTIQLTTPPAVRAGYVDVIVLNPDGSSGTGWFNYKDDTLPVITSHISGTKGENDWYISDVVITWEVSDPESEIVSTDCPMVTLRTDNPFYTAYCTAQSAGGTKTEIVQIKRDATPPAIILDAPRQGSYYSIGEQAATSYACFDQTGISGVTACNAPVASGAFLDTSQLGTFTFTVIARDPAGNQKTASATYTVEKRDPGIVWPTPASITYGTPISSTQLNATAGVPGTFTYTPAAGTILGAGEHRLFVDFVPNDTANYFTLNTYQFITVVKATPVISWAAPAAITYGTPISSTQLNATANVPGTFTYTPASGTIPGAGTYTLNVTFVPNDISNYESASAGVSLTVNKAYPVITWSSPASIIYGIPLSGTQLNATANIAGSFTYTPSAGTTLPAGDSQLSIEFVPDDSTNYLTRSRQVWITVQKATPVISWYPFGLSYGMPLGSSQLNATCSIAGTYAYTPTAGTILPAGTQVLSVTFVPNDTANYATTAKSVSITIQKANPTISWAAPANIVYGTPLSATQLNATANVPGTFTYSPDSGTILAAGTQALSLIFVPNDPANYSNATRSVSLIVQKAVPMISWATPGRIVYGIPLSSTQLNATANIAGTFAYTPALGTILRPPGRHPLNVVFTPADAANYSQANASVELIVDPATLTVQGDNTSKVFGQALPAFTATITGFVAGDGMESLNGVLSFTTSATQTSAPGTYTVMPGGLSAQCYVVVSLPGYLTISKASTSTAFSTTPNPSTNRQTVRLTATIAAVAPGAGMPSGNVQFLDDGVALGTVSLVNGVATLNTSFRKGTHTLRAVYAGNGSFLGSSNSLTQQVR